MVRAKPNKLQVLYSRVPDEEFYTSRAWRELRYEVLKAYDGKCQCCGKGSESGVVLHVDHIKPRSKHPDLELKFENLQVLCEDCNLGKSNKDYSDWRRGKPIVDKKWVTRDPTVRLPVKMLESEAWKKLSYSAQSLYTYMRASMFKPDLGVMNVKYTEVMFSPAIVPHFNKKTYYGAMKILLDFGFVKQVVVGGHGRKAVYDMTTLDWQRVCQ